MNTSADQTATPRVHVLHWRQETRATVTLALPLVFTLLAYMAILTTDVLMMGWLGPKSLAAGSLSAHFYGFFEFFCMATLGAVAPIVAQNIGARRFRNVRRSVRQGLWLAVILTVPCSIIIWHTGSFLVLLGQDPELAFAGQAYVRWMVLGLQPAMWHTVFHEFLTAHARPRASLVIMVLGIAINGLADYALMFGHFGFPQMGLEGAGIASAFVSTFMFLMMLAFISLDRRLKRYVMLGRFWRADWSQLMELLRVGIPMGVTEMAEGGMFAASALLMGLVGTEALAAHAITVQCAALAFMVPLGIGQAATVRVGRAVGAGNLPAATRAGWNAQIIGICFAFLPAAAFWFLGSTLVALFLDTSLPGNNTTVDFAVSFFAIAALFQFADSTQVTALGALRGYKDTRGPMIVALVGYWGIGLPSAAFFGIYLGYGGEAIWYSLVAGLTVVSAFLLWRLKLQTRT